MLKPLIDSFEQLSSGAQLTAGVEASGEIIGVRGQVLLARLPLAAIGDECKISCRDGSQIQAQVIAFDENFVSLAAFDDLQGVIPGAGVTHLSRAVECYVSQDLIGEVVDAFGLPLSSPNNTARQLQSRPIAGKAIDPLTLEPIRTIFRTGIKSIDSFCTIGRGQRIGIFAGPGSGKSTLLGMLARNSSADLNIIALVGERIREVRDFIEHSLGPEGLSKSIVVVATSAEAAVRRQLAAYTATVIAEFFRDRGQHVLLLMDSLTRMARATRDVGLAAGEFPVRQGYTASVYSELPKLLERAGNTGIGSITAFYTILTAEDPLGDPLGEEVKSILDGHLVLNPALAQQGIRPAIDLTQSISRLLLQLRSPEDLQKVNQVLSLLGKLKREKELLLFGGVADQELQAALQVEADLTALLNQNISAKVDFEDGWQACLKLLTKYNALLNSIEVKNDQQK